jgi:hypothetical protein
VVLLPFLIRVENHVCLSRGVQVTGAAWRAATRIVAGIGDLVQRIGDGHTGRVLGGWMIGRSGDAAVCTVHVETRSANFLVEPRNQGRRFVSGLTSKPLGQFISGLTLKPLGRFISGLTSKLPGQFSPVWR